MALDLSSFQKPEKPLLSEFQKPAKLDLSGFQKPQGPTIGTVSQPALNRRQADQLMVDTLMSGAIPLSNPVSEISTQLVVGGAKAASNAIQFVTDTFGSANLSTIRKPKKTFYRSRVDAANKDLRTSLDTLNQFDNNQKTMSLMGLENTPERTIELESERLNLTSDIDKKRNDLAAWERGQDRVSKVWGKEDSKHRKNNVFANFRSMLDKELPPTSPLGVVAQVAGQYGSPFMAVKSLITAQGARAFVETTFGGSLAATLATGPEHNNIANLLVEHAGFDNLLIKGLQIQGDDNVWGARFKNLVIDFGLTGGAVAAFRSYLKLMTHMRRKPLDYVIRSEELTQKNSTFLLQSKARMQAHAIKDGATSKEAEAIANDGMSMLMGRSYDKSTEIKIRILSKKPPPKLTNVDDADKFLLEQRTSLKKVMDKFKSKIPFLDRAGIPYAVRDLYAIASDEIGKISRPLQAAVRKQQMDLFIDTHAALEKATPLINMMGKLRGGEKRVYENVFSLAIHNRNKDVALGILRKRFGKIEADEAWKAWNEVSDDLLVRLRDSGYENMGKLSNFFHREVVDYAGLQKYLKDELGIVADDIFTYKTVNGVRVKLSVEETQHQINKYMLGQNLQKNLSHFGATKERSVHDVTKGMLKFYADPLDAMAMYIERSIANSSKRKFFGQGNVMVTGEVSENLDSTIASYISKEFPKMDEAGIDRLQSLLNSVYGSNGSEWAGFRNMRGATSAAFLGNPESALTQLGDFGVTAAQHGIRATTQALYGQLFKKTPANIRKNLGIDNVGLEHTDAGALQAATNKVMKWSGFQATDHLGKNININAALISARGLLKTPKGLMKFRKQYDGVLSQEEINQLASDLAGKEFTPLVKFHMWNSLTDVQPISKAEMPVNWLNRPNGRVFYQFLTFMLKQLSNVNRTVVRPLAEGRPAFAAINATKYGTYFAGATLMAESGKEALRSFLPGGDGKFDMDQVTDKTLIALLRVLAYSDYQASKGDGVIDSAIKSTGLTAIPIVSFADNLLNVLFQRDDAKDAWKMFPLVGKNIHRWIGDGAEKEASDAGWNTDFGSDFDAGFDEGF